MKPAAARKRAAGSWPRLVLAASVLLAGLSPGVAGAQSARLVFDPDRLMTIRETDAAQEVTFTVKLNRAPSGNVTVRSSRDVVGSTDTTVSGGGTLTFTTTDWNTPQTVTVRVGSDGDSFDEWGIIGVATSGGGFGGEDYGGFTGTKHGFLIYISDDESNAAPRVSSITRSSPSYTPTNSNGPAWGVSFSQAVQNVTADDFSIAGTTASLSVSRWGRYPNNWLVTASGGDLADLDGTITLSFVDGQDIENIVGTALTDTTPTGNNRNTYVIDNTAPYSTATARQTPATARTRADLLEWRLTFSERLLHRTGSARRHLVTAADFRVTGTDIGSPRIRVDNAGDSDLATWDVKVDRGNLANLNGTVRLEFAANHTLMDWADNPLTGGLTGATTFTLDNAAPGVTITGVPPHTTEPFTATFTFDEDVTDFDAGDVTLTNATKGTFRETVSGRAWTLRVTPSGDYRVSVDAGGANDEVGNPGPSSAVSKRGDFRIDGIPPSFSAFAHQRPRSSPTNADRVTWRATFSEGVTNVDAGDFRLTGARASLSVAAVSGNEAAWDVTASGGDLDKHDGSVTLAFASGQDITDLVGNALSPTPSATNTWTLDNTAPTPAFTGVPAVTNAPFTATLTFSEPVQGFDPVNELRVANARVTRVVETRQGTVWTADVRPDGSGDVTLSVPSGAVVDLSGNRSAAASATARYGAGAGLTFAPSSLTIAEGDGAVTGTYKVKLSSAPTANVTVAVTKMAGGVTM